MMEARSEKPMDRYLSRTDVFAMAIGVMVGWGAFVMPGTTFLPVAGPAGSVLALAIGALLMLVIGANFAWLMRRSSRTGGVYAYTKEAFGRDHAFLSSWFLCLSYLTVVFLNGTALFVVVRTMMNGATGSGLRYTVAGNDIYLSEVLVSVAASEPGYYNLVLMDIQMPVMDGYTATRTIRALEDPALAGVPIVAMTANAFAEDVQAAKEAGMQAHIAKPVDIAVLHRTLQDVLRERRS